MPVMRSAKDDQILFLVLPALGYRDDMMRLSIKGTAATGNHTAVAVLSAVFCRKMSVPSAQAILREKALITGSNDGPCSGFGPQIWHFR